MFRCFLLGISAAGLSAVLASSILAISASSQAIPAARRAGGDIRLGFAYTNANSDEASQRVGGFSGYGSYTLLPHFAFLGEVNLVQFFTPQDYAQRTYEGGGKVFFRKKRLEPYAKFLGGVAESIAQESYVRVYGAHDSFGMFAGGGGLDIHVSRRFVVRAIDYERQVWPGFSPRDLSPALVSFGVAYRLR